MTTGIKPQDKTVSTNGINLHYLDWGTAGKTPLILLHGLRGHAHSWDDVSAALCPDFHVLALDQRGRGDTDWAPGGDYSTNAFVADFIGSENLFPSTPNKRLSGAIDAIDAHLPSQAGSLFALPINGRLLNGQRGAEDDQVGSALASDTFLGRPIRLEVGRNDRPRTT